MGDGDAKSRSPEAWWSTDGTHWTRASVPTHRRDAFVSVAAGNNGLVATSLTFTTPGHRFLLDVRRRSPLDVERLGPAGQ